VVHSRQWGGSSDGISRRYPSARTRAVQSTPGSARGFSALRRRVERARAATGAATRAAAHRSASERSGRRSESSSVCRVPLLNPNHDSTHRARVDQQFHGARRRFCSLSRRHRTRRPIWPKCLQRWSRLKQSPRRAPPSRENGFGVWRGTAGHPRAIGLLFFRVSQCVPWLSSSALWFKKILEPPKARKDTEREQSRDSSVSVRLFRA